MIEIKTKDIVKFFDTREDGLSGHISSIIGLVGEDLGAALFQRYYKETFGKEVEISGNRPLGVTSNRKGRRLDRWVYVRQLKVAYQTEIKNWSAYAIGGRSINHNSDIKNIAMRNWEERIISLKKRTTNGENKVFCRMKVPVDFPAGAKIEPLLIYWQVLSRDGRNLYPFFAVDIGKNGFKKLNIFSISNYLRSIRTTKLKLNMSNIEKRVGILKKHFKIL